MRTIKNSLITLRILSFNYALNGIRHLWKKEANFRIHLFIGFIVIICAWYTEISKSEWLFIIFCIGIVLGAEAFNSAIERICDFICAEQNNNIKIIKDLAAAAVLMIALTAAIAGIIIFVPKL